MAPLLKELLAALELLFLEGFILLDDGFEAHLFGLREERHSSLRDSSNGHKLDPLVIIAVSLDASRGMQTWRGATTTTAILNKEGSMAN